MAVTTFLVTVSYAAMITMWNGDTSIHSHNKYIVLLYVLEILFWCCLATQLCWHDKYLPLAGSQDTSSRFCLGQMLYTLRHFVAFIILYIDNCWWKRVYWRYRHGALRQNIMIKVLPGKHNQLSYNLIIYLKMLSYDTFISMPNHFDFMVYPIKYTFLCVTSYNYFWIFISSIYIHLPTFYIWKPAKLSWVMHIISINT